MITFLKLVYVEVVSRTEKYFYACSIHSEIVLTL